GGSRVRHPVVARRHFDTDHEAEEWSPSPSQDSWHLAPWWSRSSTEGCCREDGAEEGSRGENRSPPSRASAWSKASVGIEEEGRIDGGGLGSVGSLATRPKAGR